MKGTGNIFNWLGMKEEKDVLSLSTKHVKSVLSCVTTFVRVVEAYQNDDSGGKHARIGETGAFEREADQHRIEMIRRISETVISPMDREDLLKFTLTVDRIADWTYGAARLFAFLEKPLPGDITANFLNSAHRVVAGVVDLQEAIDYLLAGKYKEAIEKTLNASLLESQEDDQKHATLGKILHSNIPTAQMIVACNLAEHLEGITDKIEDAADFIRIIAVKTK